MTAYEQQGFKNRKDYLTNLAEEFEIDTRTVFEVASMLGEAEDFDGLINALEDTEAMMY